MMKQPLFGQDSSPHYTSRFFGYAGTAFLWIIFFICLIFIKPAQKEPKYKTIQIVLDPPAKVMEDKPKREEGVAEAPIVEMIEAVVEQPVTAVSKSETPKTEPVIEQKLEETPKKITPKEPPKKTETAVKKVEEPYVPPVVYKSVEELMQEQTAKKVQKKDFNWDAFENEDLTTESVPQQNNKVTAENSIAGTAANTTEVKKLERVASSADSDSEEITVSANTIQSIGNIRSAVAQGDNSLATGTETQAKADSGNGTLLLDWDAGRKRELIEPKAPVIILKNTGHLVTGSIHVIISFTVVEAGNIPRGDISFTPEAVLPAAVREEIKDQICKWRFEYADDISNAKFKCIVKK